MSENAIEVANTNEIQTTDSDFNIPAGYICTVDINTIDGKIKAANALNGATPLKNHVSEDFVLADVITTSGIRSVSNVPCTNTYLITDGGDVYFTQSDGVARSVKTLVALFKGNFKNDVDENGEIKNAIRVHVKCVEQPLNNGNTLKTLVPTKVDYDA